jgi:hypothetical protein
MNQINLVNDAVQLSFCNRGWGVGTGLFVKEQEDNDGTS